MTTDRELVKQALTEIYRRNGYTQMDRLAYRDHEHLSQRLEAQTGTLISVSTLKRLLNGEFSRIPQSATLQALAHYLGYTNWQDYKMETAVQVPSQGTTPTPRSHWPRYFTVALASVVMAALAVLFIRFSPTKGIDHADTATFSAEKTTSNDIPNTVVFHYNIDDVQADSFFIQQSWDRNRRVQIFKNTHTLTDLYYEPGYHVAKLMANDSIIRTVDVSIPTDRWFIYTKDQKPAGIPQYIKHTIAPQQDGNLRLAYADLEANQIDPKLDKEYVYTYFPSQFTITSDNFIFKTRVRVHALKNNACPNLMVEALTQRQFMYVKSTPKGCANQAFTQFGEQFYHGRKNDLSALAYDVTEWMTVEIKVEHRTATVTFDGKNVFSTTYKTSCGLITGLAFISNGIPEVDYIDVRGLNGEIFYQNDFTLPL